ncbi:hypothetical protein HDV00_007551 [Rhizophlyctis rosea]|nr:hypothetical protein HDV00_007551 [Rhizophlyctis rosea]
MLARLCSDQTKTFQRSLESGMHTGLKHGTDDAVDEAPPTSERWGYKPNKQKPEQGGLAWNTHKAVCARGGEFKNIDFNTDLTRPMQAAITGHWDKTFSSDNNSYLMRVLNDFENLVDEALQKFFAEVHEQLSSVGDRVTKVSQQVKDHIKTDLTLALEDGLVRICESQKEISRLMTPTVQKEMMPVLASLTSITSVLSWSSHAPRQGHPPAAPRSAESRIPIIVVPNVSSPIITQYNVEKFLTENTYADSQQLYSGRDASD